MLQQDSISEWDITSQSLDLFFIWCVEDIFKQRGIKDTNENSLGHQVDTRGRMYLQYLQEGVASSSSSQSRAQDRLSGMPARTDRWSSISLDQEYLAYLSHLDHRYTTDALESVIKSSKTSSQLPNHSSLSQVGMPSLGWIKMHLRIVSGDFFAQYMDLYL